MGNRPGMTAGLGKRAATPTQLAGDVRCGRQWRECQDRLYVFGCELEYAHCDDLCLWNSWFLDSMACLSCRVLDAYRLPYALCDLIHVLPVTNKSQRGYEMM